MGLFNNMSNLVGSVDVQNMAETLMARYVIGPTPGYNAMRCSDRKSCGNDCSVCYEVCPVGIYPEGKRKKPVWTQCIKCGICAASCPDRCITPPAARVEQYMMALSKKGETVVSCREDGTATGLAVSCLAAVSWEQMACAALDEGLVISLRACKSCEKENFKQLIAYQLDELHAFLGDELFQARVRILGENEEYRPEDTGMSRRELFQVFRDMPLDRALRALPAVDTTQDNGLIYRALLRDYVEKENRDKEPSKRAKFRVRLPIFTEKCYNCGTCERLCPQRALKLENRDGKILVTVDVWRCVGCGICGNICKAEGISGVAPMRVSTLGRVALKQIQGYPCESCGKLRPKDAEEGLCESCMTRRRMIRLRDEHLKEIAAKKQATQSVE